MFAGVPYGRGNLDGTASIASFDTLSNIAVDGTGNTYVIDRKGLRRIAPTGIVSTAYVPAVAAASLGGIIRDSAGNIVFVQNSTVRRMTPAGIVTTLAGMDGASGFVDGVGTDARVTGSGALATDAAGNVYKIDSSSNRYSIRKITAAGVVSTLFDGTASASTFGGFGGIAADAAGNLYVSDTSRHTISRVSASGTLTLFAGSDNNNGNADGLGAVARFSGPGALAVDAGGNLYVADINNQRIRRISPSGLVVTLTPALGVALSGRNSLTVDAVGNIYLVDFGQSIVLKIDAAGLVTTLAGTAGQSGLVDGKGTAARFSAPSGNNLSPITTDSKGNLYVTDTGSNAIRMVIPDATVSTLLNIVSPLNLAVDGTGATVYYRFQNLVLDFFRDSIFKLTPDGTRTLLIDGGYWPHAVDSLGRLYATRGGAIFRITSDGQAAVIAGSENEAGSVDDTGVAARFRGWFGLALDGTCNIYVADSGNNTIRKVTPAGAVSTIAGTAGVTGSADGLGTAATFNGPISVAVDTAGNVYVDDAGNYTIRRITPAGMVSTIAGVAGSYGFVPGVPPGVIAPQSLTLSGGALYIRSNGGIVRFGAPP